MPLWVWLNTELLGFAKLLTTPQALLPSAVAAVPLHDPLPFPWLNWGSLLNAPLFNLSHGAIRITDIRTMYIARNS